METRGRAHRLAAAATLVIPIAVVVLMTWLAASDQALAGRGWKDSDSPAFTILVSLIAAVGWLGGTSILVVIFTGPTVLPRWLGILAVYALLESHVGSWPDGTADAPAPRLLEFASTGQLVSAALITLPACALFAPLLLGWLVFRPSVYGLVGTVAVAIMGIALMGWSLWLAGRVLATRRAAAAGV